MLSSLGRIAALAARGRFAFDMRGMATQWMRIGQRAEELWRKDGSPPQVPGLSYSPLSISRSKTLT
jgi:hypothetical protein